MRGERLSRRPPALEGRDYARRRCALRRQFVLGRGGFGVLQLQFQLFEQTLLALRAHAVERALQLLDLKLEMGDQRVGLGSAVAALVALGFRRQPCCPLGQDHRMRGGEIGRERFGVIQARAERITAAENCKRNRHPDALGRHVCLGIRQSMPDKR